MAVPDYQSLMLLLLQFAYEKNSEASTNEAHDYISHMLNLCEDDIKEMLPSGVSTTLSNRVGWAETYLKKAGLLEKTRRSFFRITERGKMLIHENPKSIDVKLLQRYPEFCEFKQLRGTRKKEKTGNLATAIDISQSTPSEVLESAYVNLRSELADELLLKLKQASPSFFEKAVVELLVKMGYGGSRVDAGKAIGRSGDGGIDGIINEDKLGLDIVYIQAKRWDTNPVGSPDIMQFAGALQAKHANKGVFITTSRFTEEAQKYVSQIGSKIVLIDGEKLTNLMIENDIGVNVVSLYPVKRVDNDYFEEGI